MSSHIFERTTKPPYDNNSPCKCECGFYTLTYKDMYRHYIASEVMLENKIKRRFNTVLKDIENFKK